MKKVGIIISTLLLVLLLVAVIVVPKIDVLKTTNITTDEDYKEYERLRNEGLLDENNNYIINYSDPDKIRVSFAKNKLMDVEYYLDESYAKKIEDTAFLMPGDTIYFKHVETKGENKELYKFSRFEVYEISDEFGRERIVKLDAKESQYTIPENFKGKEMQIIPLGEYEKGTIHLNAFCSSYDNLKEAVNTGTWFNGNTPLAGNILNVGPSETYTLSYKYNADEYFFIGSSPEYFSQNQKEGFVEFNDADSSDSDHPTEFKVELKRYLKLNLEFDKKAKITLNGDLVDEKVKKYEFTSANRLKFDDVIVVETEGNIQITDGDYKYVSVTRDRENEMYKYIITIDAENLNKKMSDKICKDGVDIIEDVTITFPSKNEYGVATYKVNSKEVKGKCTLKEGDKISIEYTITSNGYIFSDQNAIEKFFKVKTKTETIEITVAMDGTRFDLSKYVKVEKEDNK